MEGSVEFVECLEKCTPRQAEFVRKYLVIGNATEAYKQAGYTGKAVGVRAYEVLKVPRVAAAVKAGKLDIAKATQYDAKTAMKELEDSITFAKETKNATAVAKLVELKMKLTGLLIERIDQRQVGSFTVEISGINRSKN